MKRPNVNVYVGRMASGKSTLARRQSRACPVVLAHDPNGEDEAAAGSYVTDNPAELAALVVDARGPLRICWRGTGEAGLETLCRVGLARGDCALLLDEVDLFTAPGHAPPMMYRALHTGRHRGLSLYLCARRPHRLFRDATALATTITVFHSTEPRDLKFLAEYMGEAAAAAVPGLAPYHAVVWTADGNWAVTDFSQKT